MKKKWKIVNKLLICLLGMAFISGQSSKGICSTVQGEQEDTREYIIQADTQKQYNAVLEQYSDEISMEREERKTLEDEKILTVELNRKQLQKLQCQKGIQVEKDSVVKADRSDIEKNQAIRQLHKGQWNRSAVNMTEIGKGKEVVRVAVLDSGYDKMGDADIKEQINFVEESDMDDMTGHGTSVTNIIAENQNGMGKGGLIALGSSIDILSVKVLDDENQAPISRVVQGIQWCIEQRVDVINMSFGMSVCSEIFHDVIKKAEEAGILMIASVGNNGEQSDSSVQYPAAYGEVIGVGSVDEALQHSTFSAKGREVELVAPGENVPISACWKLNGVGSGTSYSAPHITAIAALLLSRDASKSPEFIRELMKESASKLGDSSLYGSGLVNYERALEKYPKFKPGKHIRGEEQVLQIYQIPECVKASWSATHHNEYIKQGNLDEHRIKIIKYAVAYADSGLGNVKNAGYSEKEEETYNNFNVLHGRDSSNYVFATKCLYEASLKWSSGKSIEEMKNLMDLYKRGNTDSGEEAIKARGDRRALKRAVVVALTKDMKSGEKISSKEKGKLQLLGLAIHIAGDAYAHRTICDNSADGIKDFRNIAAGWNIYNKKLEYFLQSKYTETDVLNKVKTGKLMTSALAQFFRKIGKMEGGKYCNDLYTDNPAYLRKRHTVGTQHATKKLLSYYVGKKEFTPYVYCPVLSDSTYHYKLRYLMKFIEATGLKMDNNICSVEKWKSMSD